MNTKYFLYAIVVTLVSTVVSWSNLIDTKSSGSRSGSSFSTGRSYGGGGGGHK